MANQSYTEVKICNEVVTELVTPQNGRRFTKIEIRVFSNTDFSGSPTAILPIAITNNGNAQNITYTAGSELAYVQKYFEVICFSYTIASAFINTNATRTEGGQFTITTDTVGSSPTSIINFKISDADGSGVYANIQTLYNADLSLLTTVVANSSLITDSTKYVDLAGNFSIIKPYFNSGSIVGSGIATFRKRHWAQFSNNFYNITADTAGTGQSFAKNLKVEFSVDGGVFVNTILRKIKGCMYFNATTSADDGSQNLQFVHEDELMLQNYSIQDNQFVELIANSINYTNTLTSTGALDPQFYLKTNNFAAVAHKIGYFAIRSQNNFFTKMPTFDQGGIYAVIRVFSTLYILDENRFKPYIYISNTLNTFPLTNLVDVKVYVDGVLNQTWLKAQADINTNISWIKTGDYITNLNLNQKYRIKLTSTFSPANAGNLEHESDLMIVNLF
jgi:hypothetical protein